VPGSNQAMKRSRNREAHAFFREISDGPLGFILCMRCEEWSAVGEVANLPYQFSSHVEDDHPRCTAVIPDLA